MSQDITFDEAAVRRQAAADGITHISTGVAVARDGRILMTRRAAGDYLGGQYELPGGGVDPGETIQEGAIREVREETGLTVTRVLAVFDGLDYTTDKKPKVRQFNFLVEVEDPTNVQLDPNEHDDYAWVDRGNLADVQISDDMRQCVSDALDILTAA